MKKLIMLTSILILSACTETPSVDAIYNKKEQCGNIAAFLNKKVWRYEKQNGDWLCLISKDGTDRFDSQIVLYQGELRTVVRFITIQKKSR